jgi:tRNA modification GTPase
MYYCGDEETIAALATGKGKAALAVIRISGKEAIEKIKECLLPEGKFQKVLPNRINRYNFIDNETKKIIDEITAIKFVFPESYTGENMVELVCHGSEIIIEDILSVLIRKGIRLAQKGEFTRRAYLNGKMDLMKAESIDQIIQSTNRIHHKCALEMYTGNSKKTLIEWKNQIIAILSDLEARIEFPEEDDILGKKIEYKKNIAGFVEKIEKEIKKREKIKLLDFGFNVPIAGIANAGKSSLFNLIVGFNRTIVHHEEGTTRDAVSEEAEIKGRRIKIIDTAGLNETDNTIEKIGIKKAWEYIENGNMIILVSPANQELKEDEKTILKKAGKEKTIVIISKNDLKKTENKNEYFKNENIPFMETCLLNDQNREKVLDFIGKHMETFLNFDDENGIICNKRQEEIFFKIRQKGKKTLEIMDNSYEDMISYELKGILNDFEEFFGEIRDDEILDAIFSEFCVGK